MNGHYQLDFQQIFWGPFFIALYFYLDFFSPAESDRIKKIFSNISFIIGIVWAATVMGLIKYQLLQFQFEQSITLFLIGGFLAGVALFLAQKCSIDFSKLFLLNTKVIFCLFSYICSLIFFVALKKNFFYD